MIIVDSVIENRLEITFSNFLLVWFFITVLLILGLNSIASVALSNLGKFSSLEIDIPHIIFLFWIPILLFSILMSTFRFRPIDFSYESIKYSFLQKLFYLLTSAIFISGYFVIKFLVNLEFGYDQTLDLLIYILLLIPFFIWIIITIKLKKFLER